jgi:hypothetical protein
MNQAIGAVLVIGGMIAGALYYNGNLALPNKPVISTAAKSCCDHYRQDLATIYGSAAKRLRSGEIKSQPDLKAFFNFGRDEARERCFAPIGKQLADSLGKTFDATKAANACEKISADLK